MHIAMRHFESLDPDIAQHLISDTLDTLTPPGEDDTRQQATRDRAVAMMLEAFAPGTPFEAMVASHIVALHHGGLGCYRWSMQTDPTTPAAARLRRDGIAMTRTMLFAAHELQAMQDRRGAPQPPAAPVPVPRRFDPMPSEDGAEQAAGPAAPVPAPATPPQRFDPMPSEDAAEQAAPGTACDLTHRTRGATDFGATRLALRALEARDPATLTDDEARGAAEGQGHARAPV